MLKKNYHSVGAAVTAGILMAGSSAHAGTGTGTGTGGSTKDFGDIAANIVNSIADLPGLISALAYLFGTLIGVLGIMKIKDHVENPTQTPLKDGAIRLAAGGALFALPIIYEAMFTTAGDGSQVAQKNINAVQLGVTTTP